MFGPSGTVFCPARDTPGNTPGIRCFSTGRFWVIPAAPEQTPFAGLRRIECMVSVQSNACIRSDQMHGFDPIKCMHSFRPSACSPSDPQRAHRSTLSMLTVQPSRVSPSLQPLHEEEQLCGIVVIKGRIIGQGRVAGAVEHGKQEGRSSLEPVRCVLRLGNLA